MNLKRHRLSANLTQSELSQLLKIKRSTVAMWETGKSIPTSDKLPELAKIFNCTIDELFEEER